jgi:hypothetical protein
VDSKPPIPLPERQRNFSRENRPRVQALAAMVDPRAIAWESQPMQAANLETPRIGCIAYDADEGTLRVTIRDWGFAEYRGVPEAFVRAWLISRQPDEFFDRKIRYRFQRLA